MKWKHLRSQRWPLTGIHSSGFACRHSKCSIFRKTKRYAEYSLTVSPAHVSCRGRAEQWHGSSPGSPSAIREETYTLCEGLPSNPLRALDFQNRGNGYEIEQAMNGVRTPLSACGGLWSELRTRRPVSAAPDVASVKLVLRRLLFELRENTTESPETVYTLSNFPLLVPSLTQDM